MSDGQSHPTDLDKKAQAMAAASKALQAKDGGRQEAVNAEMTKVLSKMSGQMDAIQAEAAKTLNQLGHTATQVAGQATSLLLGAIQKPIVLLLSALLLPLKLVNSLMMRLRGESAAAVRDDDDADPVDWDEEMAPKDTAAPEVLADINDLLDKNIVFCDNRRQPLYSMAQTRGLGKLSRMEMELAMELAMNAIRECADQAEALPVMAEGRYAGRRIADVMREIEPVDVQRFFHFARTYAASYTGKNFRLSETFATWLLNNAP